VKDLLVIRLKREPPATALATMSKDFADIMVDGKIEAIKPTPDEVENEEHLAQDRLGSDFRF